MGLPDCSFDLSALLVPDASVLINLNATGCANQIFDALPNKIAITDIVIAEIAAGRVKGRTDSDLLDDLLARGRVERVALTAECEEGFLALVAGSGASTLDDGEAATIAWAAAHQGIPIIDEKKGIAICRERFALLQPLSTIDIFACEAVQSEFGGGALSNAIHNALVNARMRIPEEHLSWVLGIIGKERARECSSLPRWARELA